MGEMRRAQTREEQQRREERFASTLVIGACVIAAVRLARKTDCGFLVKSISIPA